MENYQKMNYKWLGNVFTIILAITKMQIKTILRFLLNIVTMTNIKMTTNVGCKGVKGKHFFLLLVRVKIDAAYITEISVKRPPNARDGFTVLYCYMSLGIYPWVSPSYCRDSYSFMFNAVLFITIVKWQETRLDCKIQKT